MIDMHRGMWLRIYRLRELATLRWFLILPASGNHD
jgi:hypothetical protein